MKALILAAGRGKRMDDLCEKNNKCLIKVAGKPLIEYSLECAIKIGFSEILIIVGHQAEKIINAYGNTYKGHPIKYVFQAEQKGLVHAIACAKKEINEEDFMLMLGDELMINPKHKEMIEKYQKENIFSICGILSVDDKNLIKKTYAVICKENDEIVQLIEKPHEPPNNIMGTGNCLFRNAILSYIDKTPINPKRGEQELVDLIMCAVNDGKNIKSFPVCEKYFNINWPLEIDEANSYFLHH